MQPDTVQPAMVPVYNTQAFPIFEGDPGKPVVDSRIQGEPWETGDETTGDWLKIHHLQLVIDTL